MDERGYWHNQDNDLVSEAMREFHSQMEGSPHPQAHERAIISSGIGETVKVFKADGSSLMAVFESAEKNKVTCGPLDTNQPRPYLELAETVTLESATGESVKAQVWDNRNGKLILRTLPI